MASVGVHVLGGNPNSASMISGRFGNPFDVYLAALKATPTGLHNKVGATVDGKKADWLSWVILPTKASILSGKAGEINGADETNAADETNQTGDGGPDEVLNDTEATVPSEQPDSKNGLDESFFDLFKKALSVAGPMGMIASKGMGAVGQLLR